MQCIDQNFSLSTPRYCSLMFPGSAVNWIFDSNEAMKTLLLSSRLYLGSRHRSLSLVPTLLKCSRCQYFHLKCTAALLVCPLVQLYKSETLLASLRRQQIPEAAKH